MTWMEFALAITGVLAWPAAILIAVLIVKREIDKASKGTR